ncbi:MAG: C4-dicarboxylate ABC transporter permease [Clostridiaceae bacterium BRH_c20a]|nr:MAG: C4-dicarboxylate ABC transporter permease [Clostridiaceae bacterium BRH_c20a]
MLAVLLSIFIGTIAIGVPIAVALILGVAGGLYVSDIPLLLIGQKMYTGIDSYTLLAIPFFILAGTIMQHGGMGKRLVRLASVMVGHISGGLGMVSVVASMFFGALTGSAPATTAAVGGITIPEMTKRNYDPRFSGALCASSGILGVLIPPSIPLVLYGVVANVSIIDLFMGGIMPGIILGLLLMVTTYVISKKRGYRAEQKEGIKEFWAALKDSFLALLVPFIILGGIYGGIFTPTESGVVASVYALMIGMFWYKEINFKKLLAIAYDVAENTATIMLVVGAATLFGWILTNQGVPQKITQQILTLSDNPIIILFVLNIIFLVVGMFMNQGPAILILAPILIPVISKLGIDVTFYGVIMTMVLSIGQVTPPVSLNLFVASRITGLKLEELVPDVIPFLLTLIAGALALTYMPDVVMFIPNLMK